MTDQEKAVDRARHAFATSEGIDAGSIQVGSVEREQIPNPPLAPEQMSIGLVRYRYYIQLCAGNRARRFRVEAGHVYDA